MPWQKEMHVVMTFFHLLISHVFDESRKKLTHTYSGTSARVFQTPSLNEEAKQQNYTGICSVSYFKHQTP